MNEFFKLLVWQMAQILGYEGQTDLAEHACLLLVDYDINTCHPVFIGKQFVSEAFDPALPWDGAVQYLLSDVISEEYRKESEIFFSEHAARRKFEKQRVNDSINYMSQLLNGKKWTHCIQSIFTSQRTIQYITAQFIRESSFLRSPGILFPDFDPSAPQPENLFTPEGSAENKEHLLSYFLVIEVDEIRKSIESLRFLARHDQLTGLYNRHMMAELVDDGPSVVIILDIDNFKEINDTYGHAVGDEALCNVAGRLEAIFWQRQKEFVFRLGGDEFLVVMKDASEEEAVKRLKQLCEPVDFISADKQAIHFTLSAGYTLCNGDFKGSMKSADMALYLAKNNGRNSFRKAEE